jgi:hypothetical protein
MTDGQKRKRQGLWRCSPQSTTTATTYYWAAFGGANIAYQALVQNQQNHPIGGAPSDKRGELLKGHPPVFSHATDPLEADN